MKKILKLYLLEDQSSDNFFLAYRNNNWEFHRILKKNCKFLLLVFHLNAVLNSL